MTNLIFVGDVMLGRNVSSNKDIFKNVADEFYRRLAVPYEDRKIDEEGDVDLYEDLLKDIKK